MTESEVILKAHAYFRSHGICEQPVARIYTDAHSTLLPHKSLRPFQRFTVSRGDFVLHPDLVGLLRDGETIFAVEAKGKADLLKGLTQAEMYRAGFHLSFLAADRDALGESFIQIARSKDVGILSVGDEVTIVHRPEPHMPLRDVFKFVYRQMETVIQVSGRQTFQFNIPTHYLVWAIALDRRVQYSLGRVRETLMSYPIPEDWRSALVGAQKLGLVSILGDVIQLTPVGGALKDILPKDLDEWSRIHSIVGARGRGVPLVECQPVAAAALRLLLLQDPMVRLVVSGLETFSGRSANFAELAVACDQLDRARALVFFLKPVSAAALLNKKGEILWGNAIGQDYRSSMFYQYKSIMKHAGILKATRLGGATSRGYEPTHDVWELI